MEITGRLTADASVQEVNSDKKVVNFTIAINDNYKPKGSAEVKEVVTYINCSYWLNATTAQWLKKGTLVQLFGRIGMSVYNNSEGVAVGTLTFHTNNIKILVFPKKEDTAQASSAVKEKKSKKAQDVPF